jgi:hypothetical protein
MVAHDKERFRQQRSLCRAYWLAARQREHHGNIQTLCRAAFRCRAACRVFAVICFFAVRSAQTLPCICSLSCATAEYAVLFFIAVRRSKSLPCYLCLPCVLFAAYGKDFFAVRRLTAMIACTATDIFSRSV